MSPVKNLFYEFSSFFPMSFLQAVSPIRTLFPYHHTVSNTPLEHIVHLYNYKNEKQFENDLEVLLKYNKPVSLSDLVENFTQHQPLPKKSFLLSFDDGFREVHDVIAPILKRKGLPAVFFINPDFIDNKKLFYRCKISLLLGLLKNNKPPHPVLQRWGELLDLADITPVNLAIHLKKINQNNAPVLDEMAVAAGISFVEYLEQQKPFLTTQQVQALHKDGFAIGAHSMNHPYYQLIPFEQQLSQTLDSVRYVNEMLNTNDTSFSFPHSDANLSQVLMDELNKSNIPLLFGIQNQQEESKNKMLHRFNAERPKVNITKQLKGIYFMLWMKHLVGVDKVKR